MSTGATNTTNNNNAEAPAPRVSAPTQPLGVAENTAKERRTGISYINKFLDEGRPFGDDNITSFEAITPEHLEEDNMMRFLQHFYGWLADSAFFTRQNTWLSTENKIAYRKYAKNAIKEKFPNHPIFQNVWVEWHKEMETKFRKQCDRSRQDDDNINETRKSEPLYRDVSNRDIFTAIRAKYLGLDQFDCRIVSTNLLKSVRNKDSASKLAEFNISRAANARGSEHYGLRWDEGSFDLYYQAPDFDWIIFKQLDRQCMFFFCDLTLYMLCPFFGLAVYFLYGGLRRDDAEMGPSRNFVFPHLHKMKRDSVSSRMTNIIRSAIDVETRKKAYTSRSTRKGQMGELRMNRDISLEEQYAHSGHTHPSMNPNAEGYIESNPAISAPGAMASAGYINCHMRPHPCCFDALGAGVYDSVTRLVVELFTNDMPRLQPGGNLRPVIMICAARLVCSYNDLVKDLGTDNAVVRLIMEAARRAKIEDDRVQVIGPHLYHAILTSWSTQIKEQFKKDNDQVSRDDPKVNEELLRTVIDRLEKLEASAAVRDGQAHHLQLSLDQLRIQQQEVSEKEQRIKELEKHIRKLQKMLTAAQQGSPASPVRREPPSRPGAEEVNEDDGRKRAPAINLQKDLEDTAPPPSKKPKSNSSAASASSQLDGIQNAAKETKVGGISVAAELERMWDENVLVKKSKELEGEEVLSKEVLFSRIHTQLHAHPIFKAASAMANYDRGMSFVAMAISDEDWKKLCAGELDDKARRELFNKIEKETMLTACETERTMLVSGKAKEKSQPTIHSLGTRLKDCETDRKKINKTFDMHEHVLKKATGKQTQRSVLDLFNQSSSNK